MGQMQGMRVTWSNSDYQYHSSTWGLGGLKYSCNIGS